MENSTTDRVSVTVPDSCERRWVVLACTFKALDDPETGEEAVILEFSLDHAISPEDGGPASANDPGTWADLATANRCRDRWRKPRSESFLGFVADGELYTAFTNRPPQPIGSERPAQVRL